MKNQEKGMVLMYQKIEDLFLKEKSQIRAKGGRTISRAEKGEI